MGQATIKTQIGGTVTAFEMIMDQLVKMQKYGRIGQLKDAKACLEAAKDIFSKTKDSDEKVKANCEYFTTNFSHFDKMVG